MAIVRKTITLTEQQGKWGSRLRLLPAITRTTASTSATLSAGSKNVAPR